MKEINDDIVCIIIGFFILMLIASGIALLWVLGSPSDGRIIVTVVLCSLIILDIIFIISENIKLKSDIRNLDYKIEHDNRFDIDEIRSIIEDEKEKAIVKMISEEKRIYDLAIEIDYAVISNDLSLDDRRSIARTLVNLGYVKKEEIDDEEEF